jgi:hypothetical protein
MTGTRREGLAEIGTVAPKQIWFRGCAQAVPGASNSE